MYLLRRAGLRCATARQWRMRSATPKARRRSRTARPLVRLLAHTCTWRLVQSCMHVCILSHAYVWAVSLHMGGEGGQVSPLRRSRALAALCIRSRLHPSILCIQHVHVEVYMHRCLHARITSARNHRESPREEAAAGAFCVRRPRDGRNDGRDAPVFGKRRPVRAAPPPAAQLVARRRRRVNPQP